MQQQVNASRAAASIALRVLQGVLTGIAQDGMVPLEEVDRLIGLIERGTVELDRAYAAARQRCEDEETRPRGRVGMRSDPLNRLLVRPFESMFFEVPPSFERKFLPAYFAATRQLLGTGFATYDEECKKVIQSLLAVHGSQLSWDMVYADPRIVSLIQRTIGSMAGRISGAKGQALWVKLMLKPAAGGAAPTEEQVLTVREVMMTFLRNLESTAA